jgi:hypothetical protein
MDLRWWAVVIVACVALAAGIVVAVWRPVDTDARHFRPLANADRLTSLPGYVRAVRRRALTTAATLGLLTAVFVCALIAGARPTGLPTAAQDVESGQPEDIMVCAGAPASDAAVAATMRYFAGHATTLGTQRIGLTVPNRRVIPLTRDHQFASARFGEAAASGEPSDLAPAVRYADYAQSVSDLLALCLTGFPEFEEPSAQRRSVIYVGPGDLRSADDPRPALFDADRLRTMAQAAGAQVNVLVTGPGGDELEALARDTGGRSFDAQSDVAGRLAEIRSNPPPPTPDVATTVRAAAPDSPDIPLAVAVLAVAALSLLPMVVRR